MTTAREKAILHDFINTYRENTCLWKVKSKEYMDKNKKDAAYALLLIKLKELNPDAETEDVKKKINSLRSCFRKEYKKVMDCVRSGMGTDELYQPQLWYFESLMFLKDHEVPKASKSTSNPDFLEELSQVISHDLCVVYRLSIFLMGLYGQLLTTKDAGWVQWEKNLYFTIVSCMANHKVTIQCH